MLKMNCMKNKPFVLMTFCHTLFEKCNNQVIFHDIIGTWLNCHTCASGKSWKLKQVYRYLSCVYVLGKAECLKNLTIFIGKERDSSGDVREDFKFLISGFRSMFEGLNDSLETIHFMTSEDSHNLLVDILKLLSEHCKNLTKIVADSAFKISKFPSIGCFQNLKQLTVPKLCYIDGFVQSCDTVTDIYVEKDVMANLKNYDLGTMCQKFKKLKRCYLNVRVHLTTNWRQCYEWQNIVDENFQESTEVKFVFKMKLYHVKKVTKLPYQKSAFEFLMKYEKDEMDQGLEYSFDA